VRTLTAVLVVALVLGLGVFSFYLDFKHESTEPKSLEDLERLPVYPPTRLVPPDPPSSK